MPETFGAPIPGGTYAKLSNVWPKYCGGGGSLRRFKGLSPKERRSSLAGIMRWYKELQREHKRLMKS